MKFEIVSPLCCMLLHLLWLCIQRVNSLDMSTSLPTTTVILLKRQFSFDISSEYDFFVPEVDVVCQCSCTNDGRESCRPVDNECALLVNFTTTCTNYITVNTASSICSKYYKLCCQVYFTKTKTMKPFKAFYLTHHQTLLTFQITSKSRDSNMNTYNVTISGDIKNLLVSYDKVLLVHEFNRINPIPKDWYFIEDDSNELLYSESINVIDEMDMKKIGWFQYNVKRNELSRESLKDLEKHLQVKLLDCHSNPPKYEWKLNATHYVRKGIKHLPENVKKVSEMYTDISKYSIYLDGKKMILEPFNPFSVNSTLSSANSYPFMFTSSIRDNELNLTFTKGNGTFDVDITCSSGGGVMFLFNASSANKINKLPNRTYDSCWVCISQNNDQLCEIPSMDNDDETPIGSTTVASNTNSHINGLLSLVLCFVSIITHYLL